MVVCHQMRLLIIYVYKQLGHTWAPCGHDWSCVISDWYEGPFFDILKPQTHVSLVKCTQLWSFNWSAGNFNWSTPPFQSVAIGPYIPIGPRAPTYELGTNIKITTRNWLKYLYISYYTAHSSKNSHCNRKLSLIIHIHSSSSCQRHNYQFPNITKIKYKACYLHEQ